MCIDCADFVSTACPRQPEHHARRRSASALLRWAALLVAIPCLSGCKTYVDHLMPVRTAFSQGYLGEAEAAIDLASKQWGANDHDCLQLERAVVDLAEGKPKDAEKTLREMRDRFDDLEQKAIGENALSMLTDANRKAYAGEDYEKVLIRAFLALSNLMTDGQDAGAYALQVADKQQQIINAGVDKQGNNPKLAYGGVAVGAYIHGLLREETHSNFDDVQRCCTLVCNWQPQFPYGAMDLERARHGHHSAPGNGVVYVFALVGVGPYKEETVAVASSVSLLIADQILSAIGKETLPPTIAPIKVPKLVRTPNDVANIGVSVAGRPTGRTETISDVGSMAMQQYDAIYPRVVAEAVVRRIIKKGIIYGGKEAAGVQKYSWADILLDLVGVAWEATEAADTRCWGLLPDKIQVLRFELPAGQHEIGLQSLGGAGTPLGHVTTQAVSVVNGRNTYVLANFPYYNVVGKVLTNQQ
jgi:hypothetical protein